MGQQLTTLRRLSDQSRPPPTKFTADDIQDLTGQIMVVTGGNTGVGKETIKALLKHNATVYLAARSKEKAEKAIVELEAETGKTAIFLQLDLSSLKSVKAAVEEFKRKETKLHVLFNNAGVMVPPLDQLTEDGYDMQFGTNCLGHWYFTRLLIPTMIETAKDTPDKKARVVTTSSSTHMFFTMDFDTFRDGPKRKKLGKNMLYSQSKFGNVVVAREFARRYGDQGIVSTSVNPGNLKTELQRHTGAIAHKLIDIFFSFPAPMGALTQLYAGLSPETADANGEYFIPWARKGPAREETADPDLGHRLWDWLEEQVVNV